VSGDTFGQALRDSRRKRGLSLRKMQVLTSYDFTYLGQVERGEKPGSLDLAEMCDRALYMDGTLVAKYRRASAPPTRPAPQEDEMRRRTAIKAMAATPLSFVDHDRSAGREPRVKRLEQKAEIYRHLYHGTSAPGDLLTLACDHLEEAVDLMRDLSDGDLKRRVLRTRSEVATLAGRLSFFDLRQPTEARGYYGLAHESASQAGDDLLAAAALGHLAFLPAAEGNPSAAVDYLGAAAQHARRTGVPLVQSWIAAVESEVLTTVHPAGIMRALEHATALLTRPADAVQPGWFDYYSGDRLDGFRGRALLQLGQSGEARASLTSALRGLDPGAVKQRAVFLVDIAASYLSDTPDVDRACALAGDAATTLAMAGYATADSRLREFRGQVGAWEHTSAVVEFDERLGALTA
jgi:transcriptional regulator with XRE-family HTH domain